MRTRHVLFVAAALFVTTLVWTWIFNPTGVRIDSQFAFAFIVGLVAFVTAFRRLRD